MAIAQGSQSSVGAKRAGSLGARTACYGVLWYVVVYYFNYFFIFSMIFKTV